MNIPNINIQNNYYNNLSCKKNKLQNFNITDSFSFTANLSHLSRDTVNSVSSVSDAYREILKKISQKTPEGMEIIEKEYKNFKSSRCFVFHNCGENKTSIQVRVPDGKDGRDFLKIVVKKGNSFTDERVILDSFTLKNFDRIVEDDNKNRVYIFPDEVKFLDFDKPFENRLQNVLNDLDFAMLQFRKFLAKYDGKYLKPQLFTFDENHIKKLDNIDALYNKIDKTLKSIPHKLSLKLKNDFGDYKLQAAQPVHILTNIGENQNRIAYKKFYHSELGELTRVMIYDTNDEIVDGFLIKDGKTIVSNFNPKNFAVIPPKLSYYDKSAVSPVLDKLDKYIFDYERKLDEFNKYIAGRLYERSIAPITGKLSGNLAADMKVINDTYKKISDKFSQISSSSVSSLKTSYPKWSGAAGQRGFTFTNADGENISILKMKGKQQDSNLTRLCVTKDGEDQYILINDDMVVKNFNSKYPTILPPVMKYYSDIELEELGLEPFLKRAAEELQEFEKHVNTPKVSVPKPVKEKVAKEKQQRVIKEKPKHLSATKEYKDLMKECNAKLSIAMKNAENNMQEFNNVIQEIQNKITGFFVKNQE